MRGRHPDYDVLEHAGHWDAVTREIVVERARSTPPIRFFTAAEAATLRAFIDVVTGQDADPRIPVLEMVDAKLHARSFDGFRHAGLPPDDETWRRVAARSPASRSGRGRTRRRSSRPSPTGISTATGSTRRRPGAW